MQVKNKSSAVLLSEILRFVLPGTRIISDALASYGALPELGYHHDVVIHKKRVRAVGGPVSAHTKY